MENTEIRCPECGHQGVIVGELCQQGGVGFTSRRVCPACAFEFRAVLAPLLPGGWKILLYQDRQWVAYCATSPEQLRRVNESTGELMEQGLLIPAGVGKI